MRVRSVQIGINHWRDQMRSCLGTREKARFDKEARRHEQKVGGFPGQLWHGSGGGGIYGLRMGSNNVEALIKVLR